MHLHDTLLICSLFRDQNNPSPRGLSPIHCRDLYLSFFGQHLQRHVIVPPNDQVRRLPSRRSCSDTSSRNAGRRGLRSLISLASGSNSRPRDAVSAEGRATCPCLRRTGDRIERWASPTALEAAEQLGQSAQIHVGCGVEETAKDAFKLAFEPILRETERDQGVVMRPNRSVVIGHRIEGPLLTGDRSNTPTGKEGGRIRSRLTFPPAPARQCR